MLFAVLNTLLAASTACAQLSSGRTVNLGVSKKYLQRDLKSSSQPEDVTFIYDYVGFYANVSIGTPSQYTLIHIDTGSSDFWVNGIDNVQCSSSTRRKRSEASAVAEAYALAEELSNYCSNDVFDPSSSTTWQANSTNLSITYADDSFAKGYWGTDVITMGDFTISNFSIGVANNSTAGSVFGIGYTELESTYLYDGNVEQFQYLNFPARLKADGLISKVTYSLYMSGTDSLEGQLLFGGVDHAKYTGDLYTIPVISQDRFVVTLNNFLYEGNDTIELFNTSVPAMLDSGTTLVGLPEELLKDFVENLGGTYDTAGILDINGSNYYMVNCDILAANSSFHFDFGGQIIKVNPNFLVSTQNDYCFANVVSLGDTSYIILGDTFLISAYVIYDLEDSQIAIAQASYSDDEDIEPIISTIPSAKSAPGYSSTVFFSEIDHLATTTSFQGSASIHISSYSTSYSLVKTTIEQSSSFTSYRGSLTSSSIAAASSTTRSSSWVSFEVSGDPTEISSSVSQSSSLVLPSSGSIASTSMDTQKDSSTMISSSSSAEATFFKPASFSMFIFVALGFL